MSTFEQPLNVKFREVSSNTKFEALAIRELKKRCGIDGLKIISFGRSKKTSRRVYPFSTHRKIVLREQQIKPEHLAFYQLILASDGELYNIKHHVQGVLTLARDVANLLGVFIQQPSKELFEELEKKLEPFERTLKELLDSVVTIGLNISVSENGDLVVTKQSSTQPDPERQGEEISAAAQLAGFELLHALGCKDTFELARKIAILFLCDAVSDELRDQRLQPIEWKRLIMFLHQHSLLPIDEIALEKTFKLKIGSHTIIVRPDISVTPLMSLLPDSADGELDQNPVIFEEHKLILADMSSLTVENLREKLSDGRTLGDYLLHSLLQALKMEVVNPGLGIFLTHDREGKVIGWHSAEEFAKDLAAVLEILTEHEVDSQQPEIHCKVDELRRKVRLDYSQDAPHKQTLKTLSRASIYGLFENQVVKLHGFNFLVVRAFPRCLSQRWHILPVMVAILYNSRQKGGDLTDQIHGVLIVEDKGDSKKGFFYDLTSDNRFETAI